MLLLKAAVVAVVAKPATKSWFKSLRTGVIVAQGGEFGFALLILLLPKELLDPAIVQPLLAATVLSMVLSPLIIRHNRRITRFILRETGNPLTEAMRQERVTLAAADRDHVVICGFGRVGQNIARVLEQTGFEYIALDVDPYRIRTGRQAGDPVVYGDAGQVKVLENVGLAHASVVVITFANPDVALRILRAVRELRADVPDPGAHAGRHQAHGIAGRRRNRGRARNLRGQSDAAVALAAAGETAGGHGDSHRE